MEKKEYKQPEVKVVEIGNTCMDTMSESDPNRDDAVAKRGTFDLDNSFDTEE